MKCISNWASKSKYSLFRLKKNIWNVIGNTFAVAGVLLTIAEGADEIFEYHKLFELYKNHFWLILGFALLYSIIKNWDRLEFKVRVADSPDVAVVLKVGDALQNKGAVVIPTNTTFDTDMKDDFISEGSLQGQYQLKHFRGRIKDLDKLIDEGLEDKAFVTLNDGRKNKTKRYPIGTVCRVSGTKKRAYFLADSDINKNGISNDVEAADITEALFGLWESLNSMGNMETYSIPFLGTGKAGVKNASRDDIIKQILVTFLAASKEHKLTEKLIICVHPSDYEKIHWDDLCEYIKYQCQFANVKPRQMSQRGKAEKTPKTIILKTDEQYDVELKAEKEDIGSNVLSEKESKLINLLIGNEMKRADIAAAMGLSLASTSRMLKRLEDIGIISSYGPARAKVFYVSKEE